MKLTSLLFGTLCLGGLAGIPAVASARNAIEGSMLVTGIVEVNPNGTMHSYSIDRADKLPAGVVALIGRDIPDWTFEMPAPVTDVVRTKMTVRVITQKGDDGKYDVSIAGTSFDEPEANESETIRYKSREPSPKYPRKAAWAGVPGTVYLLIRVGPDGTVQEAIAEQVNLRKSYSESDMRRLRKLLADASLEAAMQWTFLPPTQGPSVANPYWVVRVPVEFAITDSAGHRPDLPYGSWDVYIPGPRQSAPWVSKALLAESPDAISDSEPHAGNPVLHRVTPPGDT